jgi:beta-galactosidase
VGEALKKLAPVKGTMPRCEVALICDTENRWALEDCQGPRRDMRHDATVLAHYRALKRRGLDLDVIDETCDFSRYSLIAAPMLYMLRPGAAERLAEFVRGGGTLVCTCPTGRVDRDDLCFLGGFPGPLREVLGIWVEETDALYDEERNGLRTADGRVYSCHTLCDLIHAEGAEVLAAFTDDFYAGMPCVTVNRYGAGLAYYFATCPDDEYLADFYRSAVKAVGIAAVAEDLPAGVQTTRRGDVAFILNFSGADAAVALPEGTDMLTGERTGGKTTLSANGYRIIKLSETRSANTT